MTGVMASLNEQSATSTGSDHHLSIHPTLMDQSDDLTVLPRHWYVNATRDLFDAFYSRPFTTVTRECLTNSDHGHYPIFLHGECIQIYSSEIIWEICARRHL